MANMLMEFYGKECGHCKKMEPLIDKLEQELGVKVQRMEVWHDEDSQKKFVDEARGICQGVPFFVNTETQKTICGEASYEKLKAWAVEKK